MTILPLTLRTALRQLARRPLLTAVAAGSLAIGIGSGTALLTLFDEVVLAPFPVRESGRLVALYHGREGRPHASWVYADLVDTYRLVEDAVDGIAAWVTFEVSVDTVPEGLPRVSEVQLVSPGYFALLGVEPAAGRGLGAATPRDEMFDNSPRPVAVISHSLWRSAFGGRGDAVGSTLRLNGDEVRVVGVAPAGFRGLDLRAEPVAWIPFGLYSRVATGFWSRFRAVDYEAQRSGSRLGLWSAVARLAPGEPATALGAALGRADAILAEAHPGAHAGRTSRILPLGRAALPPGERGTTDRLLLLLATGVGAAFLIACANVAGLLLARGQRRRREIGLRLALGATRGGIARLLLTESVLLGLAGALGGLGLSAALLELVRGFQLPGGVRLGALGLQPDLGILVGTLGLGLAAALLFGVLPARESAREHATASLRAAGGVGQTRRVRRLRDLLVAAQVALCVVLLVGCGLMLRSLGAALTTDLGFEADGLLTVTVDLGLHDYDAERARLLFDGLVARAEALPSVRSATVTSTPFGSEGFSVGSAWVEGRGLVEGIDVPLNRVGSGYFTTLGIPLVRGRDFTPHEPAEPPRAIVNETLARKLWPGAEAVGRRFNFSGPDDELFEVVGVAADSRQLGLREPVRELVHLPIRQHWESAAGNPMTLVARTAGEPLESAGEVTAILEELGPGVAVAEIGTVGDRIDRILMPQRMAATLLGLFALAAVALTAVGIFGIVAFSVAARRTEIGLRAALGAPRDRLLGLFVCRGLAPVIWGAGAGLVAAAGLTRGLRSLLYGIEPLDPVAYLGGLAVLAAAALAAALLPARAALDVDPTTALREE